MFLSSITNVRYTPNLNDSLQTTQAGRQFAAWLHSFNLGDVDAFAAFVRNNYHDLSSDIVNEIVELAALTGGLTLFKIERLTDSEVVVIAQERYSLDTGWREIMCCIEANVAGVMQPVQTRPVEAPMITDNTQDTNSFTSDVEEYLAELVAAGLFSGAVQIVQNHRLLFQHAYGFAHRGYEVQNTVNTKFNVGSINKMFTAVAVAQLVEQGKLSFDDPLSKHLSELKLDVAERVTIHQLLTHTSGMGNSILEGHSFWAKKDHLRSVDNWLAVIKDAPLEYEPGSCWAYSNRGFLVLGAVIERINGHSYFDYVRTHIFASAAMHNTDFFELDEDVPNRATGYLYQGLVGSFETLPRRNNLAVSIIKGSPHGGGGGYSTASDLLSFASALQQHRLLGPTTQHQPPTKARCIGRL